MERSGESQVVPPRGEGAARTLLANGADVAGSQARLEELQMRREELQLRREEVMLEMTRANAEAVTRRSGEGGVEQLLETGGTGFIYWQLISGAAVAIVGLIILIVGFAVRRRWPSVTGSVVKETRQCAANQVTECSSTTSKHGSTQTCQPRTVHTCSFEVEYEVEGKLYRRPFSTAEATEPAASVTVFYDPAAPSRAQMGDPDALWIFLVIGGFALFAGIGTVVFYTLLLRSGKSGRQIAGVIGAASLVGAAFN